MRLPLYKLFLEDEDESIEFVSFVDEPAVERTWQFFSKQHQFKINDEEQIVSGISMVANLPIYRRDPDGKEYYVQFDTDTVKRIAQNFFKNNKNFAVNINHSDTVDGVYMFESFLIDRSKGKMPPNGFENVTDGSWYTSFKVTDESLWKKIKSGELRGFSIEGMFKQVLQDVKDEQTINKIVQVINELE